jgi:hypothetical protein
LQRWRFIIGILPAVALAAAVAGCKNTNGLFDQGPTFNPNAIFIKPDWAVAGSVTDAKFANESAVAPDELVGADGRCSAIMAQAPAPAVPAPVANADPNNAAVPVGDGASGPDGQTTPLALGAVALGMSECDAVRHAGIPARVDISANEKGQRAVVLTYLGGPWPGIYHFAEGRLKEIERAPVPPEPPKPEPKKKKKSAKPKTVARPPATREYVQ